jgi:hypothetical protein
MRQALLRGRASRGRARTRGARRHRPRAAFATWRSLALDESLDDGQAVEL